MHVVRNGMDPDLVTVYKYLRITNFEVRFIYILPACREKIGMTTTIAMPLVEYTVPSRSSRTICKIDKISIS